MKSADVIKRLKAEGWILHNTVGSHQQYKNLETGVKVTVPHPKKDLPIGTLRSIYKQAGWAWRESCK